MEKLITIPNTNKNIAAVLHLPLQDNPSDLPLPVVIMSHGFSGDKIGPYPYLFVLTARLLAEEGYAVLRYDFTGSGDSEGRFEDQNLLTQVSDLQTVINYLETESMIDTQRVTLLGHSRGGAVSIMQAASNDLRIKCLVTWAAAAHWNDIWADCHEVFKEKGYIEFSSLRQTRQLYEIDLEHEPRRYAKEVTTPWLILHGSEDGEYTGTVFPSHAELLYATNPTNREVKIIPGAGHTFYSLHDRELLWQHTTDWLKLHG